MAAADFHYPPLDHSLVFPELINFHMERNPSFPMFLYTREDGSGALTQISFLEFGRAAHRIAHTIRPSRQGLDGEVVMVIALTDTILHHAVVSGLSIAGWVPFPVSPRNSTAAVVNMMRKTNCSRIVTLDHAHKSLINDIREEIRGAQLIVHELPTFSYAFPKIGQEIQADPFTAYPSALEQPDLDAPAIYVHSSGSTGFPKAVAHTHRIQIQWLAHPSFRLYAESIDPRRFGAMALPAFHIFGIVIGLYATTACLVTAVVFPPRTYTDPTARPVMATSDSIIDQLKKTDTSVLFTVPIFLEHMAMSDEAIEVLKKLDYITCGGGPLPVKIGQKLWAAGVQLVTAYGGTEFGVPVATTTKQDIADGDWMWVRFSSTEKIRWAPLGDDTYELHILSTEHHKMAVENLPDLKGYATADVFVKHPMKNIWKIVGRTEDLVVLASAEKIVPAPMENIIASSPLVQGIVMFGRGRNQVGFLIEPRPEHAIDVHDEKALTKWRNDIWPTVEEAKRMSPVSSRIFREMILLTSKDKPMLRAPKGTIQRKATLNAYETEISALYDTFEASSQVPSGSAGPSAWTCEDIEQWLLEHGRILSPSGSVDPRADLFAQGFESLSATYLRNRILGALQKSSHSDVRAAIANIPVNIICENPTIHQLSSRLAALVKGDRPLVDAKEQHKQIIDAMIERYSVGLSGPANDALRHHPLPEPTVVLLTGSTGGLGSLLLAELIETPAIRRIFALNRPCSSRSIKKRQRSAFKDKRLQAELLDSTKLVYIEADASLPKCGLSVAQYEIIRNSVTLIIHNAWRLDFNLSISSFEDNIRASRHLVDLGLDSLQKEKLRFLFTSSISTAQGWDNSKGPFPEEISLDPSVAIGTGYGEGKYAAERIILKSGLRATALRISQIAGGHAGTWATTDWFPILVKSSIALGALPQAAGVVSWLRGEEVAAAIMETAFSKEAPPPVLNMSNPSSTPWADIIASVRHAIIEQKGLHGEGLLPVVPFREWFEMLENKAENAVQESLINIPAIKLLEFFRMWTSGDEAIWSQGDATMEAGGIPNCSTTKMQQVSVTMANMQEIGTAEATAWVGYWISKGAL